MIYSLYPKKVHSSRKSSFVTSHGLGLNSEQLAGEFSILTKAIDAILQKQFGKFEIHKNLKLILKNLELFKK